MMLYYTVTLTVGIMRAVKHYINISPLERGSSAILDGPLAPSSVS